ncbi:MAG: hypothetical protein CVV44_12270 [Spirochaetae bacterium HGW-Spirochaetae-1]|nr:MAG: hypothetical protein CVV44_12270 [Spirochaetae bacterium HGW-Spirochaetae-1]
MNKLWRYILFLFILIILVFFALMAGTEFYSPRDIIHALTPGSDSTAHTIITGIRIPRILLALVTGAALAVSGVLFQSILKNPLADPFIMGVSGGASLGASLAIVFSLPNIFIVIFSFAGSIFVVLFVHFMSSRHSFGTSSLILTGISVSFIMSSGVLLIFAMSRSQDVHRAMMWLMGDLSQARYDMLAGAGISCGILILLALRYHKHLDILSFGEQFSRNLGVTGSELRHIFWIAALLSALSVSLAGVVGFVGLIIPHLARSIFGPEHRKLIPLSAFCGAGFLILADTTGRSIAPPYEIPVGIITGFAGGIFFLIYMTRRRV